MCCAKDMIDICMVFIFLGIVITTIVFIFVIIKTISKQELEKVRKNLYIENGKVFSDKICKIVSDVMSYNLEEASDDDFFVKHYEDIKLLEKEKQLKTLAKDNHFGKMLLKKDKLIKKVEEKYKYAMAVKEEELKYAKALKEYKNKEKKKI